MGNISILHSADLHLASAFPGLPPSVGQLRRRDFMQTLARLTALCRQRAADLFLIAGDLWEQANITRPLVDFVADQFRKIPDTIVLIALDQQADQHATNFYSLYPWPHNVHFFGGELSELSLPQFGLRVYGLSPTVGVVPDWSRLAASDAAGSRQLIIAPGSPESLAIPQWLADSDNLIYAALGSQHRYTVWADKIRDPGCPEPMDFNGADSHGVLIGTIGAECKLEFVPSASRQLHQLAIRVFDCESLAAIKGKIEEETDGLDRERDIFEVKLIGPRPQHIWDRASLQSMLSKQFILRDLTEIGYDLDALQADYGPGLITKFIAAVREAGDSSLVAEQALAMGLDALLLGVTPW